MKVKVLIISFILILLISFAFSCRKKIFNPSIPNRTEFIEEPIANLNIPSKDATVKVTPVESIYGERETYLIYNWYRHFFDFNGRYFITAIDKCSYDAANKTIKITNGSYYNLLEIDVNDGFKMKEVRTNIDSSDPSDNRIIEAFTKIVNGQSYTNGGKIFIQDGNEWYSSTDIVHWNPESSGRPADAVQKAATDQYRIKIKSQNGKTYTYMYAPGAREFSISRLDDRMKQLAKRLEYRFDFKEEDFNNHHMFDVGINEDGSSDADFRLNPTNYLNNDTNYVYMGSTEPINEQLWMMPIKKDGKDYLVRLLEHGGPEMYEIAALRTDLNTYKLELEKSLTKAIALVAEEADISLIEDACYKSIFYDANYKANKYFLDIFDNEGAEVEYGGKMYLSSNKPITHYVINIVDIQ